MPELPDLEAYVAALERCLEGAQLVDVELRSPFLLRTVDPPVRALVGRTFVAARRLGKHLCFEFEATDAGHRSEATGAGRGSDEARVPHRSHDGGGDDAYFAVVHLMRAGRLQWRSPDDPRTARNPLARFAFSTGTLWLTEAGSKRRASLHVVRGAEALVAFDRGGVEVLACTLARFTEVLVRENHTLKRVLTDGRSFAGIGNAYSDEILHAAGLSPLLLTQKMTPEQIARLFTAARDVLSSWTAKLIREALIEFPREVTAFRPDMAVHGRFGQPCPTCATRVQRIVYADKEANYCPRCQTEGRVLADRALSRLLGRDFPRRIEDWEA